MTEWPRCPQCNERMCCDGKGNYECISDHSVQQPVRSRVHIVCRDCGQILSCIEDDRELIKYSIICWDGGRKHYRYALGSF